MNYSYELPDGSRHSISLKRLTDGRYEARFNDGQSLYFSLSQGDNALILRAEDGQQTRLYTATDGKLRHVAVNGQSLTLENVTHTPTKRAKSAQAGDLSAAMPGQVRQILVEVGASVQAGQSLIILEAMKMELRVKAPHDGVVKLIRCAPGDVVERGQRLIELESPATPPPAP